jgi:hypothetical protein
MPCLSLCVLVGVYTYTLQFLLGLVEYALRHLERVQIQFVSLLVLEGMDTEGIPL